MQDPVDQRIAEENRALRALDRRAEAQAPRVTLVDPSVYNERTANYGDDSGAPFRRETKERLTALNNGLRQLHRNPILSPNEKLLSAAAEVEKHGKVITDDIEAQRYLIQRKRDDLAARIARALTPPDTSWLAQGVEIRSVIRTMTDEQQAAFLDSLQGSDALLVQYAVAGVPPALSGVAFGVHKAMRDGLLERADPSLLNEPKDIAARESHLNTLEEGVARSIAELVDFDKAAALRSLMGDPQ